LDQQRVNENATENKEKLKRVYGEHAVSRAQVFRWHKILLDGRESVEDESRAGRPCTSKTDENVFKRAITGDESWIHLKGRHFGTVDNIQKVVTEHLRALPREDFQH
jgi:hypothetical protein